MVQLHTIREWQDGNEARKTDRTRQSEREWELFQRLQPKLAATALAEGQRRSQKAYDRQVRWGCAECGGCL
jgi:hypothetical protein